MASDLIGKRIRLDSTSDPYTNLRPGDEGVVRFVDALGTISVQWENGSTLGLVPREDTYTIIDENGS
jgi:hypothetical protein